MISFSSKIMILRCVLLLQITYDISGILNSGIAAGFTPDAKIACGDLCHWGKKSSL
jgi:hypothetical protein